MSLDRIQAAAIASGSVTGLPVAIAAEPAPQPTKPGAGPAEDLEPAAPPAIDLGALSIAPRADPGEWVARLPASPAASAIAAPASAGPPRGPIDLAALSIAPTDTARAGRRGRASRRPLRPHDDVYDISPEELAERLAARRAERRTPSLKRGDLTNYHRIAAAMERGKWYTSPVVEYLTDIAPNSIAPTLARMSQWPLLYLEREERPDRPPPFLVPAPYGRGGRTLRSPARWRYRLTANGEDLRRDALDRMTREEEGA